MFKLGASHTLETTHVEFFSDEDEPEVDLGNNTNSYTAPTTPNTRNHKDHPIKNVIGDVKSTNQTRRMTKSTSEQGFLSAVWKLVDLPNGKRVIGIKWVFRNMKDERGIVIRNKARIEAIRLFLAYASFMGFLLYQMDVKSAFLYETIEEEVYVTQPPRFKDLNHPDKVYKVVKVLYGLHQAPRAWYETLANYLLSNGFKRGKIDETLFIKKQKGDIFLVQVYVDDIIFGSINKELCTAFEKLMKDKFQMSSMGELTFFLGLQVQQKEEGIFISQDKYVVEILKKFNYTDVKSASTLVDLEKPLVKDGDADDVDVHLYRSMIGSLMYLRASRADIMCAICTCARFQVTPKISHLLAYESDSDDEYVIEPSKEQEKPSFAFVNIVKHVKSPRETVKEQNIFSHLIRDCDFHKKRMAKHVELNKKKGKGTGQEENRPVWNNVRRLNHQNKFVPKAILTKTGIFPVNIARQNLSSQTANSKIQRNNFYKSHSPIRRPFNKSTAPKANFTKHKVNTVGDKTVSVVRGYKETAVKASAGEAHDVYYALKYDWKDLLHQTKSVKHVGKSKEVETLRYLSLVVALTKVGDEAIHKELGDKMERAATTTSSLKAEQDNGSGPRCQETILGM
ncbi:putative ribonuclease H-like domain-containing protein [Tanacetum coccineum]